jgi:hypothetical protein
MTLKRYIPGVVPLMLAWTISWSFALDQFGRDLTWALFISIITLLRMRERKY